MRDCSRNAPPGGRVQSEARHDALGPSHEAGFTVLGLLVVVAVVNIGMGIAVTSLVTIDRRAKEAELIWRGHQYVRALQCHQRETGGLPRELDELLESDCIRALYPEPMSRDGQWRIIREGDADAGGAGGPAGEGASVLDSIDRELRGPEAFLEGAGSGRFGAGATRGSSSGRLSLDLRSRLRLGNTRDRERSSYQWQGSRPGGPGGLDPGRGGLQRPAERAEALGRSLSQRLAGGRRVIGVASRSPKEALRLYGGESTYDAWLFLAGG